MLWPGPSFAAAAAVLLVERFTGYPQALSRPFGHPVQWLGTLIGWLDRHLNSKDASAVAGRVRGAVALVILLSIALAVAWPLGMMCKAVPFGFVGETLFAIPFLAQKSLEEHVERVRLALDETLDSARREASRIVGRDTRDLDEAGIARAALESLAENTADGVVAPALWFALLGLPGLVLYKAINTADSMIGHKSPRYRHFGWAAARLDDLVNLPGSRLTGLLFAAAAALGDPHGARAALTAMGRDAARHVSPNAGWPEAALAGALGIRLGGPRSYDGHLVELAAMGAGRAALTGQDIRAGLKLYDRALTLFAVAMLGAAVLLT